VLLLLRKIRIVADILFNVARFEYLRTMVTSKNYIFEETYNRVIRLMFAAIEFTFIREQS
jgi:hypothetical protein